MEGSSPITPQLPPCCLVGWGQAEHPQGIPVSTGTHPHPKPTRPHPIPCSLGGRAQPWRCSHLPALQPFLGAAWLGEPNPPRGVVLFCCVLFCSQGAGRTAGLGEAQAAPARLGLPRGHRSRHLPRSRGMSLVGIAAASTTSSSTPRCGLRTGAGGTSAPDVPRPSCRATGGLLQGRSEQLSRAEKSASVQRAKRAVPVPGAGWERRLEEVAGRMHSPSPQHQLSATLPARLQHAASPVLQHLCVISLWRRADAG
nr:uncharacterized protein LOC106032059 [Anser cygnoides]